MASVLKSTRTPVTDVRAVKKVLEGFWHTIDVDIQTHNDGTTGSLILSGYDSFPSAVHEDLWPDEEEFPSDDAWNSEMCRLRQLHGDQGFVAMLKELAPYLAAPLTVVWSRIEEGDFWGAGRWTVWPSSPHVQVNEVYPLEE